MVAEKLVDEAQLLETLDDLLARIEGGRAPIAELNTWFMSSEWEARMAANSAALHLGWRIQNLLYVWQDFGHQVGVDWILQGARDLIIEEPSLRPFFPNLLRRSRSTSIIGEIDLQRDELLPSTASHAPRYASRGICIERDVAMWSHSSVPPVASVADVHHLGISAIIDLSRPFPEFPPGHQPSQPTSRYRLGRAQPTDTPWKSNSGVRMALASPQGPSQ